MLFKDFLFWQSKTDYLALFQKNAFSRRLLVILNYLIWLFLFLVSFLLIKKDFNIFWQILIATLVSELVEKIIKAKVYWKRPMFEKHQKTPSGLVSSWYNSGSFPSGHTLKTTFFFLFLLQYSLFSPLLYLLVTLPLLLFRVLVGFHYPIDILGGLLLGFATWFFTSQIHAPEALSLPFSQIFNTIFFLN